MKRTILALIALSGLLLLIGCDPFGSSKTMCYITGTIYSDSAMTIPAEGISVELLVDPDSSAFVSQTVLTNTSGVFFMEVQFYPSLPSEESGTGYSMPSSEKAGLVAHYGSSFYIYKTLQDGFIVSPGDTLLVWPISLFSFGGGS